MSKTLMVVIVCLALASGLGLAGRTEDGPSADPRPAVRLGPELGWSTFLGGAGRDWAFAMARDADGNLYATGLSAGTWGSPVAPFVGAYDVFVAKLDENGLLIWNTFLGGPGDDAGYGIGVDASGNVYVNGFSKATWGTPVAPFDQLEDGFVAKLDTNGVLQWNTFLGGSGYDRGQGEIAVDAAGTSYVTGYSNATWGTPIAPYSSGWDGYAAKLAPDGSLQWSTFVGGSSNEYGQGIARDGDGNIHISGYTYEIEGVQDAFAAKLDASGVQQWNTSFGGPGWDMGQAIAVDEGGNSYVAGKSPAAWGSPVSPFTGDDDVLVVKLNANGSLLWHTFLGGTGTDSAAAVALDANGVICIAGASDATWGSPGTPFVGGFDGFVAKLDAAGSLRYNTFLGGTGSEGVNALVLDSNGSGYVLGDGPAAWGTPIRPYTGDWDGYLAKLSLPVIVAPAVASLLPANAGAGDPGFSLSVTGSDFVDGCVVLWDGEARPTTFLDASSLLAEIEAADIATGGTFQVTVRNPGEMLSNAVAFTVDNPLPALVSLSTTHVTGGGAAFTLTVLGSDFVPDSVVRWNGSDRVTTYVGPGELRAAVAASDLATGGNVQVTVFNPAPGGGSTDALTLQVSGFTVMTDPPSVSVTAGGAATYAVQVTPQYGSFDSPIAFACTGLPGRCTAAFSSTSVTPGASPATTTLTLTTRASSGAAGGALGRAIGSGPQAPGLIALASLLFLAWAVLGRRSRRFGRRALAAFAVVGLVILIGGCSAGGGGDDTYTGTPKGTHQISVQGTSGTMSVSTTITLVVN